MLQQLAAQTGSAAWAIGSMIFFLGVWVAIVVWLWRRRPEELDAQARLPLDDEDDDSRKPEVRRLDLDK